MKPFIREAQIISVLFILILVGTLIAHRVEGATESERNHWRSAGWLNEDVQTFKLDFKNNRHIGAQHCFSIVNHATGHVAVSCR